MSKAVGAYGGYLCASQPVIDLVRNRARTLIYSTGLPPAIVAAAIAALELIEREPRLLARPLTKARAFTGGVGLPQAQSTIVPVVLGEASAALQASALSARRIRSGLQGYRRVLDREATCELVEDLRWLENSWHPRATARCSPPASPTPSTRCRPSWCCGRSPPR